MTTTIVEYIWISPDGILKSKSKTLAFLPLDISQIPKLTIDDQITARPIKIIPDPFRGAPHILALCSTHTLKGDATPSERHSAEQILIRPNVVQRQLLFQFQQEYTLMLTENRSCHAASTTYCMGVNNVAGRHISEQHYEYCLNAGLNIAGANSGKMRGQWVYEIGYAECLDCSDQLWLSRFILERVCELNDVILSFDPVNGSTNCYVNIMAKGSIYEIIEKLQKACGVSYGSSSNCAIRIPNETIVAKQGYFEDRRHHSNIDPYTITRHLAEII